MSDDIEFDDMDFDSPGMDFPDDIDGNPDTTDDRSAVSRVSNSFVNSAIGMGTDRRVIQGAIEDALPEGYSQGREALENTLDTGTELYDHALKSLEPTTRILKRQTKKLLPRMRKYLPDSVGEWIEEATEESGGSSGPSIDPDEAAITGSLDSIFAQQQQSQVAEMQAEGENRVKESLERAVDGVKTDHHISVSQNMAKSLDRLAQYQDTVTISYQKKSLELQHRQYFAARDLLSISKVNQENSLTALEAISKNTSLPEAVKIQNNEQYTQLMKERLFGQVQDSMSGAAGKYFGGMKDNAKKYMTEKISSLNEQVEQLADVFGGDGGDGPGEDGAGLAGQMGAQLGLGGLQGRAASALTDRAREQFSQISPLVRGGAMLKNATDGTFRKLASHLEEVKDDPSKGNLFTRLLADLAPSLTNGMDTSVTQTLRETVTERAEFDMLARHTLVTIIPGYLKRQLQQLTMLVTGDRSVGMLDYSVDDEQFIDREDSKRKLVNKVLGDSAVSAQGEAIAKAIDRIDPNNELSKDGRLLLGERLLLDSGHGHASAKRYTNPDQFTGLGFEDSKVEEIVSFMTKHFGGTGVDDNPSFIQTIKDQFNPGGGNKQEKINKELNRIQSTELRLKEQLNTLNASGEIEALIEAGLVVSKDGNLSVNAEAIKVMVQQETLLALQELEEEDSRTTQERVDELPLVQDSEVSQLAQARRYTLERSLEAAKLEDKPAIAKQITELTKEQGVIPLFDALGSTGTGNTAGSMGGYGAFNNPLFNMGTGNAPDTGWRPDTVEVVSGSVQAITDSLDVVPTALELQLDTLEVLSDDVAITNAHLASLAADLDILPTALELQTDSLERLPERFDGIVEAIRNIDVAPVITFTNMAGDTHPVVNVDNPTSSDTVRDGMIAAMSSVDGVVRHESVMSSLGRIESILSSRETVAVQTPDQTLHARTVELLESADIYDPERYARGMEGAINKSTGVFGLLKNLTDLTGTVGSNIFKVTGSVVGYSSKVLNGFASGIGALTGGFARGVAGRGRLNVMFDGQLKLSWPDLEAGRYFTMIDGELTRIRDFTHESIVNGVFDVDGAPILTAADAVSDRLKRIDATGRVVQAGRWLGGKISKGFGLVGTLATTQLDWMRSISRTGRDALRGVVKHFKARTADVYVKGSLEDGPVLLKAVMDAGRYRDAESGTVIRSVRDIKGPVLDEQNNQVITQEMYDAGLIDSSGEHIFAGNIQRLTSKAREAFDIVKNPVMASLKKAKEMAGAAIGIPFKLMSSLARLLSNRVGFGAIEIETLNVRTQNVYLNAQNIIGTDGEAITRDSGWTDEEWRDQVDQAINESTEEEDEDEAVSVLDEMITRGQSKMNDLAKTIKTNVKDTVEDARESVRERGLGATVKGMASEAVETAKQYSKDGWEAVEETIEDTPKLKAMRETVEAKLAEVRKEGESLAGKLQSVMEEHAGDSSNEMVQAARGRYENHLAREEVRGIKGIEAKYRRAQTRAGFGGIHDSQNDGISVATGTVANRLSGTIEQGHEIAQAMKLRAGNNTLRKDVAEVDDIGAKYQMAREGVHDSQNDALSTASDAIRDSVEELANRGLDAMGAPLSSEGELETVSSLNRLTDLISERIPATVKNRVGGWRQQKEDAITEDAEETSERSKSKGFKVPGLGMLAGLFGGKGKGDEPEEDDSSLEDAADAAILGDTAKSAWNWLKKSKLGKFTGKGVDLVKSGLGSTVGRLLGRRALIGAGVAGAGALAGAGGAGVMGTMGAVLGGLVSLPATLAMGAGTGLYYTYKYASRRADLEDLERLRYYQYGIDPSQEDSLVAIRYLEDELLGDISYDHKERTCSFDGDIEDLAEHMENFGWKAGSREGLEWLRWFKGRFLPVLARAHYALHVLKIKGVNIDDIDDELDDGLKAEFIKLTRFGKDYDAPLNQPDRPIASLPHVVSPELIEAYTEKLSLRYREVATVSTGTDANDMELDNITTEQAIRNSVMADISKYDPLRHRKTDPKEEIARLAELKRRADVERKRLETVAAEEGITIDEAIARANRQRKEQLAPGVSPVNSKNALLTSLYGLRKLRDDPKPRMHEGIDIAAPTGTPIIAPVAGKITYVGEQSGTGKMVKMEDERGLTHKFMHMNNHNLRVKPGTEVLTGDVLGTVGSTGHSTGPHLHWGVYKGGSQGTSLNPIGMVRDWGETRHALHKDDLTVDTFSEGGADRAGNDSDGTDTVDKAEKGNATFKDAPAIDEQDALLAKSSAVIEKTKTAIAGYVTGETTASETQGYGGYHNTARHAKAMDELRIKREAKIIASKSFELPTVDVVKATAAPVLGWWSGILAGDDFFEVGDVEMNDDDLAEISMDDLKDLENPWNGQDGMTVNEFVQVFGFFPVGHTSWTKYRTMAERQWDPLLGAPGGIEFTNVPVRCKIGWLSYKMLVSKRATGDVKMTVLGECKSYYKHMTSAKDPDGNRTWILDAEYLGVSKAVSSGPVRKVPVVEQPVSIDVDGRAIAQLAMLTKGTTPVTATGDYKTPGHKTVVEQLDVTAERTGRGGLTVAPAMPNLPKPVEGSKVGRPIDELGHPSDTSRDYAKIGSWTYTDETLSGIAMADLAGMTNPWTRKQGMELEEFVYHFGFFPVGHPDAGTYVSMYERQWDPTVALPVLIAGTMVKTRVRIGRLEHKFKVEGVKSGVRVSDFSVSFMSYYFDHMKDFTIRIGKVKQSVGATKLGVSRSATPIKLRNGKEDTVMVPLRSIEQRMEAQWKALDFDSVMKPKSTESTTAPFSLLPVSEPETQPESLRETEIATVLPGARIVNLDTTTPKPNHTVVGTKQEQDVSEDIQAVEVQRDKQRQLDYDAIILGERLDHEDEMKYILRQSVELQGVMVNRLEAMHTDQSATIVNVDSKGMVTTEMDTTTTEPSKRPPVTNVIRVSETKKKALRKGLDTRLRRSAYK